MFKLTLEVTCENLADLIKSTEIYGNGKFEGTGQVSKADDLESTLIGTVQFKADNLNHTNINVRMKGDA